MSALERRRRAKAGRFWRSTEGGENHVGLRYSSCGIYVIGLKITEYEPKSALSFPSVQGGSPGGIAPHSVQPLELIYSLQNPCDSFMSLRLTILIWGELALSAAPN